MSDETPPGPASRPMPLAGEPLLIHEHSLADKVKPGTEAADLVDQQLTQMGASLVVQLHVLLRIARSHGPDNAALERPVEAIQSLVRSLAAEKPIPLRSSQGFLFLDERHLRTTVQQMPIFATFIETLGALGIGGLTLARSVTADELRRFAKVLASADPGALSVDELQERLVASHVRSIELEAPRVIQTVEEASDALGRKTGRHRKTGQGPSTAERTKSARARVATAFEHGTRDVREGGQLSFRKAKRAIQSIVDLLLKDEATVVGLSTLKAHDEYTRNHSVNVAVLAMALGNRAGYRKAELADLGLAALFHDIGKCAVPLDILNSSDRFGEREWASMRTHPGEGVVRLLGLRGVGQVPHRMAAASFEHHMAQHNGYPVLGQPWKPTLSTRIIVIADAYDAMTSVRPYQPQPLPPASALGYMLKRPAEYDRTLVKHFVACIGMIPIGSLVLLSTGELAVAIRPAPTREDAARPVVRVISDYKGTALATPVDYDLRVPEQAGGRYIARVIDNTQHRLDTSVYLTD